MFIFGHVGITVGVVYLFAFLFFKGKRTWFAGDIDFRLVIVAAMLPDIVDKLVGMVLFKEEISNGRLFTHSIFVIGIISILIFIAVRIKYGPTLKTLLYVPPIWMHLILDRMWEEPDTLFWPLFGAGFPKLDIEVGDYFSILLSEPYILAGEILGALIIVALVIRHRVYTKTNILGFLRDGRLKERSDH